MSTFTTSKPAIEVKHNEYLALDTPFKRLVNLRTRADLKAYKTRRGCTMPEDEVKKVRNAHAHSLHIAMQNNPALKKKIWKITIEHTARTQSATHAVTMLISKTNGIRPQTGKPYTLLERKRLVKAIETIIGIQEELVEREKSIA